MYFEQESPPAWTQEAYRPPCSEYSFCCPNWVPPPAGYPPSWPGQGGTLPGYPPAGYPLAVYPLVGYPPAGYRVPPSRVPPWAGYPPGRVPPLAGYPPGWTWQGTQPPGVCPMEFWVMLQSIMGYGYPPPPQVWTDWKHYLPHTSDAGGKKWSHDY